MSYQLEPLKKALQMPRVNLFIADDVGLGKTIEAGLILREIIMRQKVKRIVISCPASLVTQWQGEMEARFGLSFVIFDRDYLFNCRRERGYAINPWTTHSQFIVSHSLLRDEQYASPLRDWLNQHRSGSMLVLDEAHHAAPATSSSWAVDSDFTKKMRELTPLFEHRLFLSATPHNGHSNSFSALLAMLDPQRLIRGELIKDPRLLDQVMVRRLKDELREAVPGLKLPKREVGELAIGVNRAALADEVTWVPAVENRGEGVFISFKSEEVRAWRKRSEVSKREIELAEGFKFWKKQYPNSKADFVGAPYMMLHSLAHLLITQVSLECGYSSSAIRERVYAGDAGYGILLYTGSPDSEGTLGGLVEIGRKIDQHLRNAIELGRLCSNDPVCAQHSAKQMLEERFLLGAACHGCLLISETSCERFNQYLDRSLVVATVGATGAEFFTDQDLALP